MYSKEAASTAAGARTSTGVELSTHAYTAIPSAEVEFAAGSSRINMHETAASGTVTGYQAYK